MSDLEQGTSVTALGIYGRTVASYRTRLVIFRLELVSVPLELISDTNTLVISRG